MFSVFAEDARRMMVDRKLNKWCLFNKIIGQDAAVDAFADLCFKGLGNSEHSICESVMLVGPPSSGKTTLVNTVVQILNVTSVLTDATQLSRTESLIDAILTAHVKSDLVNQDLEGVKLIKLPVTVIFIDEIHALTRKVQEGLLKATERSDGMLFGKEYILDCRKVFWIGATTDWGKLIPAFRTRFRRIDLVPPTREQVIQMVMRVMKFDFSLSQQIVRYGGLVPRETFAFARSVVDAATRGGLSIDKAIHTVRVRECIDEFGMRIQRLKVLAALKNAGDAGCLLRTLVFETGCQSEELLDHWLPSMQIAPPGEKPMVLFDSRYYITATGLAELGKRGL